MIVNYNVCDQCGNQNEIRSGSVDSGIDITFTIVPTYQTIENAGTYKMNKNVNGTFCDKECMIEWLKSHVSKAGVVLVDKSIGEDDVPF